MWFGALLPYFCPMASEPGAASVRQARPQDVGRLQAIQLAAGDAFRDVGMPAVADSPPLPADSLSGYRQAGRAWGAADEHDETVGFVVGGVGDGGGHIEQVRVHPRHAGPPIGGLQLDPRAGWGAPHRLRALTFVTFRGVPWNAPYYERLGFSELLPADVTPGLAARRAAKAARGGDASALVCMLRGLDSSGPDGSGLDNSGPGSA